MWDFVFYGNKLYQIHILREILYLHHLTEYDLQWVSCANSVSFLCGVTVAVVTVDCQQVGRRSLQCVGFALMSCCFGFLLILSHETHVNIKAAIYFGASFFGGLGPGATTYLLSSECFPSEIRAIAHGLCSFVAKFGALFGAIFFKEIDTLVHPNKSRFTISIVCGVIGFLVTVFFVPDLTNFALIEADKHFEHIRIAHPDSEYIGPAVDAVHLSVLEKWFMYNASRSSSATSAANSKGEQEMGDVSLYSVHLQDELGLKSVCGEVHARGSDFAPPITWTP